jgi:hypothetical protein
MSTLLRELVTYARRHVGLRFMRMGFIIAGAPDPFAAPEVPMEDESPPDIDEPVTFSPRAEEMLERPAPPPAMPERAPLTGSVRDRLRRARA